ncbi:restriction endonuclease subunit S [Stutzerimonas kunmingensis]|uniref:restriction endonuclease subunit S n=1 Tax=Stutzerimonas kunmingensis TaxID=1211807 RepID=UPI00289BC41A|nr:restriction endonuclease subunit S [Stutzerimonas kunmingensis]
MSWPLVKLRDCCEVVGGATPKREVPEYWDSPDVPWVTPKDVSDLASPTLEDAPEYISVVGFKSCSTSMLPKGSVLVTSRAPIGNIAIAGRDLCTNQGFKSLIPGKSVDGLYLYYCMKHSSQRLQALGNGATFKEVSKKIVEEFEIPLPPLPEQKRIAAILDKADAIRRKRHQAIQLADDFLRAVFLDMFGDVIEGAENVVRLSDVAVLDAPMVDPRVDEYIDLIHIGPDRIEKKIGKLLPALTAREEGLISKKFLFDDRYVLYSKIRPYLRKCAMAEGVGLCSADMYPVRPVEGLATKEFLWMLLLSDFFTAYTESLPARANIPKLNREELEAFTFSLPEYSQQLKFSSIVRTTNIASQRVVESAAYVDGAFESLSQKAFSGQL